VHQNQSEKQKNQTHTNATDIEATNGAALPHPTSLKYNNMNVAGIDAIVLDAPAFCLLCCSHARGAAMHRTLHDLLLFLLFCELLALN